MSAALNGKREVVQLLLANGADPNDKDGSGRTASSYAASQKHADIVQILKKAGARE
jgi:ankyrin repeat protein